MNCPGYCRVSNITPKEVSTHRLRNTGIFFSTHCMKMRCGQVKQNLTLWCKQDGRLTKTVPPLKLLLKWLTYDTQRTTEDSKAEDQHKAQAVMGSHYLLQSNNCVRLGVKYRKENYTWKKSIFQISVLSLWECQHSLLKKILILCWNDNFAMNFILPNAYRGD